MKVKEMERRLINAKTDEEFMSSLKDENAFLEKTKSLYLPNGIAEKFLNNYIEETLKEYKQSFINLQKQCEDFGFSFCNSAKHS